MNDIAPIIDTLINEVRVYEVYAGYLDVVQHSSGTEYVRELTEEDPESGISYIAVRHEVWIPPSETAWQNHVVEAHSLPQDVRQFYSRVAVAHFHWLNSFLLELPGIAYDEDIHTKVGFRLAPTERLLRFCELEDDVFYALRSKDSGKTWDIVLANVEERDSETVQEQPPHFTSFTEWLKYMMRVEGWPPSPLLAELLEDGKIYGYHEPNALRRLPRDEAESKFGQLEALLPAAKPKVFKRMGERRFGK